jgi:transcriptional regulator with XRE-family HTH domain
MRQWGPAFRGARLATGIGLRECARRGHVSATMLSRVETGQERVPLADARQSLYLAIGIESVGLEELAALERCPHCDKPVDPT